MQIGDMIKPKAHIATYGEKIYIHKLRHVIKRSGKEFFIWDSVTDVLTSAAIITGQLRVKQRPNTRTKHAAPIFVLLVSILVSGKKFTISKKKLCEMFEIV